MLCLTEKELSIARKIAELKDAAGTHSPSIFTLAEKVPDLKIRIDACFLSNPYATRLFMDYFDEQLIRTGKIRDYIEFYPSQNDVIAEMLASRIDLPSKNIFVGNGATEIIQAVIHNFTRRKLVVNIPTFSAYYEFVKDGVPVSFFKLDKKRDFRFDIDEYVEFVRKEQPDTVVLINPNNPDGSYLPKHQVKELLEKLHFVENFVLDESFIHFAHETPDFEQVDYYDLFKNHPNLVIIKSMSKDFGVAGLRAGYGVMSEDKIRALTRTGYLWNTNGLAEYFFKLYTRSDFQDQYTGARVRYLKERQHFFDLLNRIPSIKAYPSSANFYLVELLDGSNSMEFASKMLIKSGVYIRSCSDKIGLEGQFARIAVRSHNENQAIADAVKDCFEE